MSTPDRLDSAARIGIGADSMTPLTTRRARRRSFPLLAAGLSIAPLPTLSQDTSVDPDGVLAALLGHWSGRAVETPVGPLPYDVHFSRTGECAIAGAANPGAAIHNWTFYRDGERLSLRFLSTFGGNTDPLVLTATEQAGSAVTFRSAKQNHVRVRLESSEAGVRISVTLRGKPHVEIRLRRPHPTAGGQH
jgi:hypothetical protein